MSDTREVVPTTETRRTNEEVASALDIDMTYASRLKNGTRTPSANLLRRIILTFELDPGATWAAWDQGSTAFSAFLRRHVWLEQDGRGEEASDVA